MERRSHERSATVRLYRGDEFVDVGTARELAERQGVKPSTIGFMASPAYHKRAKGDRILAYRLED